jgi:hypothetical protein
MCGAGCLFAATFWLQRNAKGWWQARNPTPPPHPLTWGTWYMASSSRSSG